MAVQSIVYVDILFVVVFMYSTCFGCCHGCNAWVVNHIYFVRKQTTNFPFCGPGLQLETLRLKRHSKNSW